MNKKMQLYNRLHKLNTAQIITLGFAGMIILGDYFCGCRFVRHPDTTHLLQMPCLPQPQVYV